ncbi:MAG: HlyD family type I secretion periplasmic adaptor subunit [Deltaproteobacteria bacterium]|nr:HlyD family type I secretion periplasmic adaptor subunit [Deltaproteobacteria bacterium]
MNHHSDYHDFKPILVEIEERPVNPLGALFLWTIIALMLVTLLGLFLVKVDVVVTARGKIIPLGDVKVVQPLETGVVTNIHVREGDYVKKGAVLLEIDPSVDKADLEGKERNLQNSRLAMERVSAVLGTGGFSPSEKSVPQDVMKTQTAHYRAQKDLYESTLKEKEKEYRENLSALNSLREEIKSLKGLLVHTQEDERRQKALAEIGALADNRYREKIKERLTLEKDLEVKTGQAEQTETKLERIKDEVETFKHSFQDKLLTEFTTNLQSKNSLEAEVSSVKFKQGKRFIISPVDGYIHLLPVKTVGGVVTTAQPVATIVPENAPLVVNAVVFNKDIGFVKEGQKSVIKVDTFDFQKYGAIDGSVEVINPFNLEEKEEGAGKEKERDPGTASGGYPVRLKMLADRLKTKDGAIYRMKPGMTVTAEINVGKRRVIEFFLFPVIRYLDEGLKVR